MQVERSRLSYIDHAKAIGIALICIGHFLPAGHWLKGILYSFHVTVFAYISGILFTAPNGFAECVKKLWGLIVRMLIPYTLWHTVSAVIFFWGRAWDWRLFFKTYFFLEGKTMWNDALWYLPSFFVVSVIFIFLSRVIKNNRAVWLSLSGISFAAFTLIDLYGVKINLFGYNNFFSAKNLILLFGFMTLGFCSKNIIPRLVGFKEKPTRNVFIYASIMIFTACCIVSGYFNNHNRISLLYDDYNSTVRFVVLAIIMTVTFLLSCAIIPETNLSKLLASGSLFIMSSHYIFRKYWLVENFKYFKHTAFIGISLAINVLLIYTVFLLILKKLSQRYKKLGVSMRLCGIDRIK